MMDMIHTRRRIAGLVNENIAAIPPATVTPHNTSSGSDTGVSELTISHEVYDGSNRCLFVCIGNTEAVSGVTYNGTSMTEEGSTAGQGNSYIFSLVAPDVGVHDIVISCGAGSYIEAGGVDFTGVDQTTPTSYDGNTGTTSDVDISIAAGNDDYILAVMKYWSNSGDCTPDAGQTQVFGVSSDGSWRSVSHMKAGDGTDNIGYSSVNTSFSHALSGVLINVTP